MASELDAIRADLQDLRDREAIRQLMYRYARGVDRSDLALLQSVYLRDGTDHHGHFDGLGTDFAEHLIEVDARVGPQVGNHHITNIIIDLDGDQARVETYFLAFHPHQDNEFVELGVICGRYLDVLERRSGQWGIRRREVVSDWTRNHVSGNPWRRTTASEGGYLPGRRGASDPSYSLFTTDAE